MAREIKIEKPGDVLHKPLSAGQKVSGIEIKTNLTDLDEYEDEPSEEALKKFEEIKKEREEEEGALKEKFIREKTDEIMKGIEDLSKTYVPGENVDSTKKINDMDFMRTAAKLFGLDKYFVPVEPIKQEEKETHVKPELKIVDGIIGFDEEKKPLSKTFDTICLEIMDLHAKKNKDYGNAAHESYKEFGLISYVIRLNDKMNRLKTLTKPGTDIGVKDESIEDTLEDLAAYAIMAIESLRVWR